MASANMISDAAVRKARHWFEVDGVTVGEIGRRLDVSRQAIAYWIKTREWKRPPGWKSPGQIQQAETERSLEYTDAKVMGDVVERAIERGAGVRKAKSARNGQPVVKKPIGRPRRVVDEEPRSLPKDESAPPPNPAEDSNFGQEASKRPTRGNVVAFPGSGLPQKPEPKPIHLLPARNRKDVAESKQRLAVLRGILSEQQVMQLEECEDLLRDYGHLLALYLNPQRILTEADFEGLGEEERKERIVGVQRAAMSLLLPSERDTLQGAIGRMVDSLARVMTFKRTVVGIIASTRRNVGFGTDGDDPDLPPDDDASVDKATGLPKLELTQLREVRSAMEMLLGKQRLDREPPRPPPPEPLEETAEGGSASQQDVPPLPPSPPLPE